MPEHNAPEQRTIDVDVESLDTRGRTLHGYAAVYGVESGDLGGFRERIAPGAFAEVMDADVRCLLNHNADEVLGRTRSGTLRLADEQRGLRFECDLPDSPLGENVRAAVRRGDIDGASFRFVVGDEEWDGDLRTVRSVRELRDVSVATYGAYPDASVELRTRPENNGGERRQEGGHMPAENQDGAAEDRSAENESGEERAEERSEEREERSEERSERPEQRAGALQVEDRASAPSSLTDAFRREGFPGETATIDYGEFRSASFDGDVDDLNPTRRSGVELGHDIRFAYPAFPQVAVDSDVTSVQVLRQVSRTLPEAANVIRDIDAVTEKPEVATELELVNVPLHQVAAKQSGIPNIVLEQDAVGPLVETDLRLALNEGLDKLVLDAVAGAANIDPGTDPLLVSIRKGITVVQAEGYNPDTLIVTPEDAEGLDLTVAEAGTEHYVFGPGGAATPPWRLRVRVSKSAVAPVVADAAAFGQVYVSPISLARFEENDGSTNTSLVRLEGHAAFGLERVLAAVRITDLSS